MVCWYHYINKEMKKLWFSTITRNKIDNIYLTLLSFTKDDLFEIARMQNLDIQVKVVIKYIINNKWWDLLFKILFK